MLILHFNPKVEWNSLPIVKIHGEINLAQTIIAKMEQRCGQVTYHLKNKKSNDMPPIITQMINVNFSIKIRVNYINGFSVIWDLYYFDLWFFNCNI